jgi:tetratricopeptide (TPR) repeat protein
LATGWLWYAGTLVPVIGIVQLGMQAMADRYTYIPLIGLFIMVAWGVPELLKKWKYRNGILVASSALIILCFSIITWTQVGYWQNSITLFDHTLKVTDNNWHAYNNRATAYKDLGNYKQAIADYNRAIEIRPDYVEAYNNRALAHAYFGNYKQAIEDYNRAIEMKPGDADLYYNRALAHAYFGNYKQAIEDYNRVLEMRPGYVEAYCKRGIAYAMTGNSDMGCCDLEKACKLGNCILLEAAKGRGLCR